MSAKEYVLQHEPTATASKREPDRRRSMWDVVTADERHLGSGSTAAFAWADASREMMAHRILSLLQAEPELRAFAEKKFWQELR